MLRRKPTAIAISNEDITAFEEHYARKLARAKFLKTGEDPNGWFRHTTADATHINTEDPSHFGGAGYGTNSALARKADSARDGGTGEIDPNDELKPLPGDKARIVRSREERIMGAGSGSGR